MQGGRRNGATAALTREQIVDVAERIARREGLANVTVRRVSSEIGVTGGALYWHLEDKQDLVRALVDRASTRTQRPDPAYGNWYERLIHFYLSTREEFTAYAGLSSALMTAQPTAATLANCVYVIDLLREAGFDAISAVSLFDTLSTFSWGHLMMIDMVRFNGEPVNGGSATGRSPRMSEAMDEGADYRLFIESLVHFHARRNEAQLVRGVELIVSSAAAQAGVEVPSSTRVVQAT